MALLESWSVSSRGPQRVCLSIFSSLALSRERGGRFRCGCLVWLADWFGPPISLLVEVALTACAMRLGALQATLRIVMGGDKLANIRVMGNCGY